MSDAGRAGRDNPGGRGGRGPAREGSGREGSATVPLSRIEALAREVMSPARFSHCWETGILARALCARFRQDGDKGFIAGLFHDAARGMSAAELLEISARDGLPVSAEERAHPLVLHGRAAAVILAERGGYEDPEVLWAIRDHVTGRPGMGPLSRIVLAADYLEPTRRFLDPEVRERILGLELDEMLREVLEGKIGYVRSIHEPVAEATLALKGELER